MKSVNLAGKSVGVVGLGCMGMSFAYGPSDESENLVVLERSLEIGVNHWDTADMYGGGANEILLAKVLKSKRDQVFLATKFANVYDRSMTSHQDQVAQGVPWIVDATPAYVRKCAEASLLRLGVPDVDLYYQHRVDPKVPVEETWGELKRLVEEGKVRSLGISEASVESVRRAHAVHPVTAVQSELSIWTRDYVHDVVPLCAEIGAKFVAYSPLGRGFLTGAFASPDDIPEGDWRKVNPRFIGENFAKNMAIVDAVSVLAARKGVPTSQVALAWVHAQGEHVLTIPGTRQIRYLESNAAAADLTLTAAELAALNALPTGEGDRYPAMAMGHLNL
jgi:aryl-alcohol dehydrogenase-like predicted oxidoreductase